MANKINFGTEGIRGKANAFPFTTKALFALGGAIAKWSIKKYPQKNPKVLIGVDTRISSPNIKKNLINGLVTSPLQIIDAQILSTPAVCKLIQSDNSFDFGIVISASHNPYQDNGIKLFDAKKGKMPEADEELIIKNFEILLENSSSLISKTQSTIWNEAEKTYAKIILSQFKQNYLSGKKIVLDCANGATYNIAPSLFATLGAQVITIANNPNGKNINKNCGTLYPEGLKEAVLQNKADIGFAFDGDGDRLIGVNKNGEILTGDDIITLLSLHPQFKDQKKIVGTLMSNLGVDLYFKKQNKELIRANVGDKNVAAKMEEENLLLGGEASGHIIMKTFMNSSDGIFAALKVMETIILTNNFQAKTFEKIPQILINVAIQNKKDLTTNPYAQIIQKQKELLKNGRLLVRYSGTENLLRVMVEDQNQAIAINVAQTLAKELKESLDNNI